MMVDPVDMRRGSTVCRCWWSMRCSDRPVWGSAFVFCNRAGNRISKVAVGRHGVCGCARGVCIGDGLWQHSGEGGIVLTQPQWEWLIAGVGLASFGVAVKRTKNIAERQY
ncbi:MAG: IS66 family insertion sequence element accessory protein TnpB [Nitrosomonas sp.]|nr:IS66 family insertion sequence element accessory protein TnpB [Nitrosomonas sp.]